MLQNDPALCQYSSAQENPNNLKESHLISQSGHEPHHLQQNIEENNINIKNEIDEMKIS